MAPKPLPNLYGSKGCSPGNITQGRINKLQHSKGKSSPERGMIKQERQRGESHAEHRNRRHRHGPNYLSEAPLDDTTLIAGSEIQCMMTKGRGSRDKWDGRPSEWKKLGKSPLFERWGSWQDWNKGTFPSGDTCPICPRGASVQGVVCPPC